jgi:hypothetical protein
MKNSRAILNVSNQGAAAFWTRWGKVGIREQSQQVDKILSVVLDNQAKLDAMASKVDLSSLENRINTQLDQQSVILMRLDEERHFTAEWVRRIEADVERNKAHLQIA